MTNAATPTADLEFFKIAVELHRLSLAIESAVRHNDVVNYDAVLNLLLANKAAIAKATGASS